MSDNKPCSDCALARMTSLRLASDSEESDDDDAYTSSSSKNYAICTGCKEHLTRLGFRIPTDIIELHGKPLPSGSSHPAGYNVGAGNGEVLIISHINFINNNLTRTGGERDLDLVTTFFRNYRVNQPDICRDYTVRKIKQKMDFVATKDFSAASCLIVIIMSHGDRKETIMASDEVCYNLDDDIVERVLTNRTLKTKPKIFIVQSCSDTFKIDSDSYVIATAANKNDIMKCYSTYQGNGKQSGQNGTYFIQNLLHLIETNRDASLCEVMKLLIKQYARDGISPSPTNVSTLKNKFYFGDLLKE